MNVNIEQHSLASIWLPGAPSPKKLQKLASEVGRVQVVGILRMLKQFFYFFLIQRYIKRKSIAQNPTTWIIPINHIFKSKIISIWNI